MKSGAIFSPCRTWRYVLWRVWDDALPKVAFIGLNPSTADEMQDDPTIRRCIGYARMWGYGWKRVPEVDRQQLSHRAANGKVKLREETSLQCRQYQDDDVRLFLAREWWWRPTR